MVKPKEQPKKKPTIAQRLAELTKVRETLYNNIVQTSQALEQGKAKIMAIDGAIQELSQFK